MPKFLDYLYQNCDVRGTKDHWGRLAQEGLAQELKKNTSNTKDKHKGGRNVKVGKQT